jgi:hypothetical protein
VLELDFRAVNFFVLQRMYILVYKNLLGDGSVDVP